MAFYFSIFLFFVLGTTVVCADMDPMMQTVLQKLSELTSVVQQQNEKIVQLQKEVETLKSAESRKEGKGSPLPAPSRSNFVTMTTASQSDR
jgi:hypothetical protein